MTNNKEETLGNELFAKWINMTFGPATELGLEMWANYWTFWFKVWGNLVNKK
jgi:hypothetical protein